MQRCPCQNAEDIGAILVVPSRLAEEMMTTGVPQ